MLVRDLGADQKCELTVNGDVDAGRLDSPGGSWDEEADLTGETRVFVLFQHLVLQSALD